MALKEIIDSTIFGKGATYASEYEDYSIQGTTFQGVNVRRRQVPGEWTAVRNAALENVSHYNCSISTALFENVSVTGLSSKGSAPLFLWSCIYRHVAISGRVAGLKINRNAAAPTLLQPEEQPAWDRAVKRYYENVDWALDISKAKFTGGVTFEAIPGEKIIRDPEHQVLVKRQNLLDLNWQSSDYGKTAFDIALSWFLNSSIFDSVVLAARMASKYAKEDIAVLNTLRNNGVAE